VFFQTVRIITVLTEHKYSLYYFTKFQAGSEDLFLFWDGWDYVEEATCSKAVKE
jgi:hypothetical protein